MFTQCPDCKKVYPLNGELNPDDKTRLYCSHCEKDFNALEFLTENPVGLLAEAKAEFIAKADAKPKAKAKKKRKSRTPAKAAQVAATPDSPIPLLPPVPERPNQEPTVATEALAEASGDEAAQEERLPWEKDNLSFIESLAVLNPFKVRKSGIIWHPEFFDFGGQTQTNTKSDEKSDLRLWCLAALVLLVGQLLCYSADDFSQSPSYRPYLEKVCEVGGCTLRDYQNLNEFEVLQGSFTVNPDKTIAFKAVISNQAPFKQKLPDVKLTLLDYEERIFARRFFEPGEYLQVKPPSLDINPDESKEVQLVIAAPKTPIGGYYFDLTY